ncbi:DUF5704 domain-containing protein [Paenibacillus kandeliae]|uniref:DUF5704 domain-containing protein n=1 Tax=Paenibacillus kandeliae TaxID=3231269 RepID=UPI00345B1234
MNRLPQWVQRHKLLVAVILTLLLVLPIALIQTNSAAYAAEEPAAITPLSYYKNEAPNATDANHRYFVGMMYFDMWKGTSWDNGIEPQKHMQGMAEQKYAFNFPGRKVKSIKAEVFTPTADNLKYFSASRTDEWSKYKEFATEGTTNSDISFTTSGIGTDTATIPFKINIRLDTKSKLADDITYTCGERCNQGVYGYRIYAPVVFDIELAGKLEVYYKTTDGKSLNDIFPPRQEDMAVGTEYTFDPPKDEDYEYKGYKKSTTGDAPSGDMQDGQPPAFTYKGNFDTYTAYQYYQALEPCQDGQTKADNPQCEPEEPPPTGICTWTIEPPEVADTQEKTFMSSVASGHILADDLSNDRHFDATRGIPTSENLYANAWDYSYLFNHTFDNMEGNVKYNCSMSVKYHLTWTSAKGRPRSTDETKHYTFDFSLPYAYWQINRLEVLQISGATMENYALPGGSIILSPMQTPPSTKLRHSDDEKDHVKPANTIKFSYSPPTVRGGHSKPTPPNDKDKLRNMAKNNTDDPDVRNDKLDFTFSGTTTEVMNGDWVKNEGEAPSEIPDAPLIRPFKETKEMTLYKANLTISKTLVNKANTPATGTIYFKLQDNQVNGVGDMRYPIHNINTVTVHTPVVNYSEITDDQAHNQKTEPNTQRAALILERPFTVRIPTEGQHLNGSSYPGYGDRDYAKYFRTKQVRFPFDVYNEDRTKFIAKDTWTDIPVKQLDTTFQLPVWVDEGDYTVYYRNIAENAPTNFTTQQDANTQLANHVATDTIDVEVIGRLYDFHLTDIADYNWETVFRTQKGSSQPTGLSYWVGENGIDGQPRGNEQPFMLPIHAGSHPQQGFKNAAIKLGYHFKFDLKTKGNMFSNLDGIRITTDFRYYKKDGSATVPVDLYYRDAKQTFIKIGSAQDQEKRYSILNERLRNVPEQEMLDTADWKYKTYYTPEQLAGVTQQKFETNYINNVTQQKTSVGNFAQLLLPEQLRTLIGPKTGIPTNASATVERANASIQTWYGEYSLPAETYMVERGTDIAEYARKHGGLDEKSPIWLRQGYVVVNFNIESIQQGDLKHPHLQYIHAPQMNAKKRNQWQMEGFQDQMIDAYHHTFSLQDGDVAFYHAGQSSKDDFGAQAPH